MDKLADGYGLIEGPVWHNERGLLFSDVKGGGVYAVTPQGAVSTVFEHRRGIGGMALHANGAGLIVSGRNLAYKPFDGGPTVEMHAQSADNAAVGFNDITTDSEGRIYAGELGGSPFDETRGTPGDLWMLDLDGSATVVGHDILLTNGLGFSPDGRTLYHSDSLRAAVMKYEVQDDGTLGPKQHFADMVIGHPDGLVVSEDGAVWVALASGGGGVGVYNPDGTHRSHVDIPVPMCTSVCFGGPDLRQLYIVSGSDGAQSDNVGAVFLTETDVSGLAVAPAAVPVA